MPVAYALDLSGISPANLIANELHSVNEAQFHDYYFIVPQMAPFYVDNFQVSLITSTGSTLLNEDVDYSFALPYVTGTRHTGKAMYGAITLHNLTINGILRVTYQTVGGSQVADRLMVLSVLADKAYNPRTTIWDIVANSPTAFPPVPHYQDYDTFTGQGAVVAKLAEIRDAIIANSSLTSAKIDQFLTEFNQGLSGSYVRKSGDFITGALELRQAATADLHAVTKKYVDDNTATIAEINSILGDYATLLTLQNQLELKLSKTGGTMTGQLKLSSDPQSGEDSARKSYVDNLDYNQSLVVQSLRDDFTALSNSAATTAVMDNRFNEIMVRLNMVEMRSH